ncbi:MAG TPA: flavoprotein, partial [Acidobacteriota bacterium]|nr:flavoprotein [Acidobacteriota bacterium]
MNEKRVAWAVTGAGHLLGECAGIIGRCRGVDLFLSRAGEEVVRMYGLYAGMRATGIPIHTEKKSSAPVVSRFFKGVYGVLVIAPATSNSVAKFVHGISDTLVTNLFAQAGKAKVPVIILPTDQAPEMTSTAPGDASITV